MARDWLGLANLFTIARFGIAALGVGFALAGQPRAVAALILLTGLTDVLDGMLARATGQAGALGKRLDTLADATSGGALALSYILLKPEFVRPRAVWLGVMLAAYCAYLIAYRLKYGVVGSWHTWIGKAFATVLVVAAAHGLMWQPLPAAFTVVLVLAGLVVAESAALLVLLPNPRDVRTLFHVLAARRSGHART